MRLATLELSIRLVEMMVTDEQGCYLQDAHLAALEGAREEATLVLRNFYKVWEKVNVYFISCSRLTICFHMLASHVHLRDHWSGIIKCALYFRVKKSSWTCLRMNIEKCRSVMLHNRGLIKLLKSYPPFCPSKSASV